MHHTSDTTPRFHEASVVVGVDVHKFSHAAVALDPWGQEKGRFAFSNDTLPEYTTWLHSLGRDEDVLVALEDVNGYGTHLVRVLTREGFPLRYVPAILTERERKHSTKQHKSDFVDAHRVGTVILTKYGETLPVAEAVGDPVALKNSRELDLLLTERRDLVKQKTALKNQLHALLHQHYGDHYADKFPKPFHEKALMFYRDDLAKAAGDGVETTARTMLAASIVRRLARLMLLESQIISLTRELEIIGAESPSVTALAKGLHGCGVLTACTLMAEIVSIRRFASRDKLAMYAGVAPTERSSGSHNRLYTNPFGNRRLNRALHTVALSQIAVKGDDRGKKYYQKKLKEGKTKLWALRCLKRQIAKSVFRILMEQTP